MDRARLWDLPDEPPMLLTPVVRPGSAARMAAWADGLITVNQPMDKLQAVVQAFRQAGGRGALSLQVHVSWDPDRRVAEQTALEQWRTNVFSPPVCWDTDTVEGFDAMAEHVGPESVARSVDIHEDPAWFVERLSDYAALGLDDIYVHHVGQHQAAFIDAFGEHVLPHLRAEDETG